jgi:hypothetical protein
MTADAVAIEAGNGAKTRLLSLHDIDRRCAAFKRTSQLISGIEADVSAGQPDRLSISEKQVIQRASVLGALAEDIEARWLRGEPCDPALLASLANAQRRLLESASSGLLRRAARDVTSLSDYLASLPPEPEDEPAELDAEELAEETAA